LDILWRAGITENEYDLRYLTICDEMDELRAIVGPYEPYLADEVENIHGNMNIFWGNFKEVLAITARGVKVAHTAPVYSNSYDATQKIGQTVAKIKRELTDRVNELKFGDQ